MSDTSDIAAWLRDFQAIDTADDLSRPSRAGSELVQAHLDRLAFEAEPSAFTRLLHQLAPEGLSDE
jgi:hypothetical protein